MARKNSLTADPRYKEFVSRYAFDPLRFAIEVVGITPTWQQVDILNSVAAPGSRTSISSGHGCFALGTPVMLVDGSTRPVEVIKVGDQLRGADGFSEMTVESLARGREEMHRFVYEDGREHTFNASHLLYLIDLRWGTPERITVREWLALTPEEADPYRACRFVEASGEFSLQRIVRVDDLGEGDYSGFSLDGDHLFLLGDGTVTCNTGKTNIFAVLALWHLVCYYRSNTLLTAPRLATVQDGVWKEFAGHHTAISNGPHKWIAEYIKLETKRVYIVGHKMDWWIQAKTAPVGRAENLAGQHASWLMWLCDESSGIPDASFGVIGGSLTDARNRIVLASQPTRASGFFRETHHSMSKENGGPWTAITLSSEDSPLVSEQFIRDKLLEYGGPDAAEYLIKVRGRFPEFSDRYLLSRSMIERRIKATRAIPADKAYGNFLIVDVAAGVYRDKTVAMHCHVSGFGDRLDPDPRRLDIVKIPVFDNTLDWQEVAGRVRDYVMHVSNCTVLVDVGGQGVQFAKMLTKLGVANVVNVNWGKPCFENRNKERFINLRAQCSVHAADAVKDGRITFTEDYKKELLDQGSRIPFFFDEKGRWHIQSKEDMRKDSIPSPDLWDTVCMAFIEGIHYIVDATIDLPDRADLTESVKQEAEDAFAGA